MGVDIHVLEAGDEFVEFDLVLLNDG